jgi:hypothetical protein
VSKVIDTRAGRRGAERVGGHREDIESKRGKRNRTHQREGGRCGKVKPSVVQRYSFAIQRLLDCEVEKFSDQENIALPE